MRVSRRVSTNPFVFLCEANLFCFTRGAETQLLAVAQGPDLQAMGPPMLLYSSQFKLRAAVVIESMAGRRW